MVIPPRRSSAEAFQILASHAFGDAVSPYIVGAVADSVKQKYSDSYDTDWNSLQVLNYFA